MKLASREIFLFGIIVYFTFIGGTFYSQFNFFLRLAHQIIVSLILGLWLLNKLRKGQSLPRTFLDKAIALYLAANFLSAWLGQSPRFSLEGFWFTLTHTLAFYLLVDLMRQGWTARLTWAFFMAAAVVCVVGLTEFLAWYFGAAIFPGFAQGWWEIGGWQQPIPPLIYRLAITLNGSTPLSAYLALLTPPAVGLILTLSPQNQNRQALWLWLILAAVVQILTFSRAGILALLVSTTIMTTGWFIIRGTAKLSLGRYWQQLTPLYRTLLALSGLALTGAGWFWIQSSFANRAGSTQFRFVLWESALTIFQQHVGLGAGPANFGRALLRLNQADLPRLQIASAHNIYLNTAAELGLIGLLAGGYLLFSLVLAWKKQWLLPAAPLTQRIRLLACGAALAGFMAQTLVDAYSATPIILVTVTLAAYLVHDLTPSHKWQPVYVAYLAAALLILYAAGFAWLAQADLHFQKSFAQEQAGHLAEGINQAEQARRLDPWLTLYTFRLALLEARLGQQTQHSETLQTAIEHYQAGLQQEPIWGLNSANLAGLLWAKGQRVEAIETMQQTLAAEKDPLYLVNLGYFYEQEGDWLNAGPAYGQALALAPELAGSGFWQATPQRKEHQALFIQEALKYSRLNDDELTQKLLPIKLALAAEDFDTVEALVKSTPAANEYPFRAALAEVYLSRAQPAQASALLDPAGMTSADDYLLWGRIKLQSGDEVNAEKLLKTALFLGYNQAHYYLGQLYEGRGDLRAAEAAYRRGFLPHYTAENIEVTIYGRRGANDLGPQLLRIGVSTGKAAPWLALARLYEAQQRFDEAAYIYEILLVEDPFLTVSREQLARLQAR